MFSERNKSFKAIIKKETLSEALSTKLLLPQKQTST
jgi:hypothetical protein